MEEKPVVGLDSAVEREGLEHLARIEHELEEIKQRTPTSRKAFFNGILQGAGALLGGVAAIVLLGWALSVFGLIPGLGAITTALQGASAHFSPR